MEESKLLQKKLELYEKFFEEMKAIEQEELDLQHKLYLQNQNKEIEEDFIYLDETRQFKDLHLKDQWIINEQNNLHNYHELKTKVEKVKDVYSTGKYLMYFSRWVPFY